MLTVYPSLPSLTPQPTATKLPHHQAESAPIKVTEKPSAKSSRHLSILGHPAVSDHSPRAPAASPLPWPLSHRLSHLPPSLCSFLFSPCALPEWFSAAMHSTIRDNGSGKFKLKWNWWGDGIAQRIKVKVKNQGLPSWSSGKESFCQHRGPRFNSWSRKIPHGPGQLSLCATTTEARVPRAWALQQEKPLQWEAYTPQLWSSPCLLQLEKACSQQETKHNWT